MSSKIIDVMTAEESEWICTAADFGAAFHVPHFLKSTMIVKASKNVFVLIKHLQDLKLMPGFKKVAQAILTVFSGIHVTLPTTLKCCQCYNFSAIQISKFRSFLKYPTKHSNTWERLSHKHRLIKTVYDVTEPCFYLYNL